jgi:formate hydrogenlyase subunit 6/NADH:ubiquinone oxidoreductase subunit I
MTNEYELADTSRESLIYTKDRLLAPLTEGMVPAPHRMYEDASGHEVTEKEYYRGEVPRADDGLLQQMLAVAKASDSAAEEAGS